MPEPARSNTELSAAATWKGGDWLPSQARPVSADDSSSGGPKWKGSPRWRAPIGKGPWAVS